MIDIFIYFAQSSYVSGKGHTGSLVVARQIVIHLEIVHYHATWSPYKSAMRIFRSFAVISMLFWQPYIDGIVNIGLTIDMESYFWICFRYSGFYITKTIFICNKTILYVLLKIRKLYVTFLIFHQDISFSSSIKSSSIM